MASCASPLHSYQPALACGRGGGGGVGGDGGCGLLRDVGDGRGYVWRGVALACRGACRDERWLWAWQGERVWTTTAS